MIQGLYVKNQAIWEREDYEKVLKTKIEKYDVGKDQGPLSSIFPNKIKLVQNATFLCFYVLG